MSKFGFKILGLVDMRTRKTLSPTERRIQIIFPNGTFTHMDFESKEVTLKQVRKLSCNSALTKECSRCLISGTPFVFQVIEKANARRKNPNPRIQHNFLIERKDTPGEALDQDLILDTFDTDEFYIVRENSKRKADPDDEEDSRFETLKI